METVIKYSNTEIPLSLHPATVIHANKFSETSGGWGDLPVSSSLYTEVVFRLKETGADVRVYIKKYDLPIYTSQEVMVMSASQYVIGYIDMKTQYYYYIRKDFSKLFGWAFQFTGFGQLAY